ncbi:DNA topoisomerase IB [Loktanella sp. F6476L]|uniref:DNA topoisomerase IB n=1 Tax=Loktanella sp. F6476L TaxID=2926405 RepID=UPI001FF1272F|nr:DNA topoisomerase IB [Loktanella sp. F6476L]MCK0119001.1 DNA topoisomerase IB [Loktanella sp. F6476L]
MVSHLVYVSDKDPGIARRKCGRGFSYVGPDGTTIARGPERKRIEALGIPPAYEDVWICTQINGHLQATGRDARSRKQYRYHPDWSAAQSQTKFDHLADFGEVLPKIRRRIARDVETDPGDVEFALAAAVMLIDRASLRVGNPDYTAQNGSYGALTLRRRHVSFDGEQIGLNFTAKGGKKVHKTVTDKKLQRLLHDMNDVPGGALLSWVDADGTPQTLSSHQLNAYLADAAGDDAVTAKTFRTWAGTVAGFACAEQGSATIKDIAQAAATRLHNTPTVARNSYIHPAVIDLAGQDSIDATSANRHGLYAIENRLLGLLTR